MLPILSIQNLGKSYGAKSVFENLSLIIQEREKIGLIGHNGTGNCTISAPVLSPVSSIFFCNSEILFW